MMQRLMPRSAHPTQEAMQRSHPKHLMQPMLQAPPWLQAGRMSTITMFYQYKHC